MKKPPRTPDPAAVARTLRELEKLFGKRPPEKESAAGKSGAGDALLTGKPKAEVLR